jgi:hypothetical protein
MNEQAISNTLYALGVLPAASAELSPSARKQLEAAAEREAPNMTSEGRKMTLWGCAKLKLRIPSHPRSPNKIPIGSFTCEEDDVAGMIWRWMTWHV